jgi:hypothetical protein
MSFGYSVSDAVLLVQLAWRTIDNARKACGEHDDLTKEVTSVYTVLANVESEISNPESVINKAGDNRARELQHHIEGCERYLGRLDSVLSKYNALSESERSIQKLWQKIQFGNKEVANIKEIRQKMMTYSTAISTTLQLMSLGSQGRVERKLNRQGGKLDGICEKVNLVLARLNTTHPEGTVMTNYTNDDKSFWRAFRRELVKEGYSSNVLRGRPETLIKAYVRELGERGILDEDLETSQPPISTIPELADPPRPLERSAGGIEPGIVDPTYGSSIEIEEEHQNPKPSKQRSREPEKPLPASSSGPVHECDTLPTTPSSFPGDGKESSKTIPAQQASPSLARVEFMEYKVAYSQWTPIYAAKLEKPSDGGWTG